MALVKLANDWFAPNGQHFRKGEQEVPDFLLTCPKTGDSRLPPRAVVLGARATVTIVPEQTLRDLDPERAAGEAEDTVTAQAEEERKEKARRFAEALARQKTGKK